MTEAKWDGESEKTIVNGEIVVAKTIEKIFKDLDLWLESDEHSDRCCSWDEGQFCCLDESNGKRPDARAFLRSSLRSILQQAFLSYPEIRNGFSDLRQAVLDGERYKAAGEALAKAVERMGTNHDYVGLIAPFAPREYGKVRDVVCEIWENEREEILEAYRTAIDDSSK